MFTTSDPTAQNVLRMPRRVRHVAACRPSIPAPLVSSELLRLLRFYLALQGGELHGRSVLDEQAKLLDRTWTYLHDESGATVTSRRDPSGHCLTGATVDRLGIWLAGVAAHPTGTHSA